jgi:hypothetical protein
MALFLGLKLIGILGCFCSPLIPDPAEEDAGGRASLASLWKE